MRMGKVSEEPKVVALDAARGLPEKLPYVVELWNLPRSEVERVLGRAASVLLARAIFTAALREHLGRRIVLRRGDRVLDESGGSEP